MGHLSQLVKSPSYGHLRSLMLHTRQTRLEPQLDQSISLPRHLQRAILHTLLHRGLWLGSALVGSWLIFNSLAFRAPALARPIHSSEPANAPSEASGAHSEIFQSEIFQQGANSSAVPLNPPRSGDFEARSALTVWIGDQDFWNLEPPLKSGAGGLASDFDTQPMLQRLNLANETAQEATWPELLVEQGPVKQGLVEQALEEPDIPEEILRTEIITGARSPLTGEPMSAAEYAQLQATLAAPAGDPLVGEDLSYLIFLLQFRRALQPIIPFL